MELQLVAALAPHISRKDWEGDATEDSLVEKSKRSSWNKVLPNCQDGITI